MTPAMKRVQIARTSLLLDQPFFGVLALQLHVREDPSCDTAWTDGRTLAYSPAFVEKLSNDELMALIAHEVMHCACGHPWRRDARDAKKWNIACDYAINGVLDAAGFKLPSGGLIDPNLTGKWSEWIYDRLPDSDNDGNGSGDDSGPNPLGEVRDAPADCDSDGNTETDWQQLTTQAAKAAEARGKLPAGMKRAIDQISEARVDWRSLLRRYVQEIVRADYSWTRPNVRYIAHGLFLPSLRSIACGRIVVAVDTSGSIDAVLLSQFAGEINAIAQDVQPSSVDVIYCDADVNRVDTFERGDLVTLTPCGGGGTDFRPVFERVDSDEPPAVLIYLTDLYGSFPDVAPEYPVIWAATTNGTAPFGDTVPING